MAMHNPPHSGAFIQEVYLAPNGLSGREQAQQSVELTAVRRVELNVA